MINADCPSCVQGNHEGHKEVFLEAPKGLIGGASCFCVGDCAERSQAAFDRMMSTVKKAE